MDGTSEKKLLAIEPWIEEGAMQSWRHRADSGFLVVCFRSLRIGSEGTLPYELPRAATGDGRYSTLFLTDREESWMNAPGLVEAYSAAIAHVIADERPRRVVFMGNSMGAFCALMMAGLVRADAVLAFAPQWSADPALMTGDRRWMVQRRRVREWTFRDVGPFLNPRVPTTVLHSDAYGERFQRTPFLNVRGFDHWVMKGMRHNLVQELKADGVLMPLVTAVVEDDARSVEALLGPRAERFAPRRRWRG